MESDKSTCSICLKSFRHIKHLRRHQLSHAADSGQYRCSVCSKTFIRKDGLQRHERLHKDSTPSLVASRGRACGRCVAAKTKCTGTMPCERCHAKHLQCHFSSTLQSSPSDTEAEAHRSSSSMNAATVQSSSVSRGQQMETDPVANHEHPGQNISLPPGTEPMNPHMHTDEPPRRARFRTLQPATTTGIASQSQSNPAFESPQSHEPPNIPRLTNWLQCQTNLLDLAHMNDIMPSPFSNSLLSPLAQVHAYDIQSTPTANTDHALDQGSTPSVFPAQLDGNTPAYNHNTPSFSNSFNTSHRSTVGSNTSHAANEAGDGVLYVDGERARQPRQRKRLMLPPERSPVASDFSLRFDFRNFQSQMPNKEHMTDDQYDCMSRYFDTLCVNSSIMFEKYVEVDFPPKQLFCILIDSYFDHFSDALPFIHQPSFEGSSKHFTLLLALAVLGSYFFGHGIDNRFCMSLREFLRRAIWAVTDPPAGVKPPSVHETACIQLLYAIAVRHSARSFESALQNAISYCSLSWPRAHGVVATGETSLKAQWAAWIEHEEDIRTRFCIWLVDAMFASHAERTPILKLAAAVESQLPCTESLWTAENDEIWAASKGPHPSAPSLQSTLQSLYVEKRLPTNLGEFARIVAIHAIYHRTWEVREYWQQGLSHFEPAAGRQANDVTSIPSPAPIWHPSMDVPNRWRNAALDCLDIFHWNANALIGLAHGQEHPTVLHLHSARIVLLSPLANIVRLARYISNAAVASDTQVRPDSKAIKDDVQIVRQWVFQDQYKARLAVIHAGATFWYARRFSTDAFYEPDAVALATLTLWAISKFLPDRQHGADQSSHSEPVANPLMGDDPQIVLLDRPIDDELVQQFIREGYTMHANMTGVGNLFGPHGPQRVLVEGQKLLATLGAWQDSKYHWRTILNRLEKTKRSDISRG